MPAPRRISSTVVQACGTVAAIVEIEHHHGTVHGDEGVARRVVRDPDLHIGGVRGVADVQQVCQYDGSDIPRGQLRPYAAQAIGAYSIHVDTSVLRRVAV